MRKFILVIAFLLFTVTAFAQVTATIVAIDKDDKNNICVWTWYQYNGIDVDSNYPKKPWVVNGKTIQVPVYCTRYNAMNFDNLTDDEIITYITGDIQTQTDNLIRQKYIAAKYIDIPGANQDIISNHLSGLIGQTVSSESITQDIKAPDGTMIKSINIDAAHNVTDVTDTTITPVIKTQ